MEMFSHFALIFVFYPRALAGCAIVYGCLSAGSGGGFTRLVRPYLPTIRSGTIERYPTSP